MGVGACGCVCGAPTGSCNPASPEHIATPSYGDTGRGLRPEPTHTERWNRV